jgi:hypothetical protein
MLECQYFFTERATTYSQSGSIWYYTFYVKTYFIEFKAGVNKYIRGLEEGTENIDLLEQCLIGRPMLI